VPALELASLGEKVEPSAADLMASNIKIVNFWASWSVPCRLEHPHLVDLAAEGLPIIGVNYKDAPENALKFLSDLGDPYAVIGADPKGRNAFFWGVYGIPETFLVDEKGEVLLRHAGPITQDVLDTKIRPLVEAGRNSDQVGNE
jgi:cytochrome c biogenesis protein CcmG, thiol:disulfide interchange protein DsbE